MLFCGRVGETGGYGWQSRDIGIFTMCSSCILRSRSRGGLCFLGMRMVGDQVGVLRWRFLGIGS